MPPTSSTSAGLEQPLTLGQQHRQAFDLLLDYDWRARQAGAGQKLQDLQATWFGLQVTIGKTPVLLPQQQLAEVLSPPALTPLPGTPPWLLGLANHYGQLLPVVDLFGFIYNRSWGDPSQRRVIITDSDPRVGFVVSQLGSSVRTAPPTAKDPSLGIDDALSRWVGGQVDVMGTPIATLDLSPLIEAVSHWKRD